MYYLAQGYINLARSTLTIRELNVLHFYLAYATALVSLMTVTLICPG